MMANGNRLISQTIDGLWVSHNCFVNEVIFERNYLSCLIPYSNDMNFRTTMVVVMKHMHCWKRQEQFKEAMVDAIVEQPNNLKWVLSPMISCFQTSLGQINLTMVGIEVIESHLSYLFYCLSELSTGQCQLLLVH